MARPTTLGIALGAGAARGWAHVGVVQRLAELGVVPDVVAGCSIGAFVGAFVAAERSERLARLAHDMSWLQTLRLLDWRVGGGGLIHGETIKSLLDEHLGPMFVETLPKPFGAATTDLATGRERWLRDGELASVVRASMALPGVMAPQRVGSDYLIDGALTNPVPVSLAKALGAEIIIAVMLGDELTQSLPVPSTQGPVTATVDRLAQAIGIQGVGPARDVPPGYFEVVSRAMIVVQNFITRIRLAAEPADILLVPDVQAIGLHEFHRAEEAIAAGRAAVDAARPQLERRLGC